MAETTVSDANKTVHHKGKPMREAVRAEFIRRKKKKKRTIEDL